MTSHLAQIDPLRIGLPIVDQNGGPTPQFMRAFNSLFGNVSNVNRTVGGLASASPAETTATGSWIPLVDGAEPPNFITDGAGHLILVAGP